MTAKEATKIMEENLPALEENQYNEVMRTVLLFAKDGKKYCPLTKKLHKNVSDKLLSEGYIFLHQDVMGVNIRYICWGHTEVKLTLMQKILRTIFLLPIKKYSYENE